MRLIDDTDDDDVVIREALLDGIVKLAISLIRWQHIFGIGIDLDACDQGTEYQNQENDDGVDRLRTPGRQLDEPFLHLADSFNRVAPTILSTVFS